MSLEDHASDILRCHYGTLSQSLRYPISVAQLLHEEQVISQTRLTIVKFTTESFTGEEAIFLLLKAIRRAVHSNYYNLKMFISVLLTFSDNVPLANVILKDCGKYMSYTITNSNDILIDKLFPEDDGESKEILIPRKLDPVFGSIRKQFAIAFSSIRDVINESPPPLDKLKQFLADGYSHLRPQISHSASIDEILDIVNDHCTLINISCLEGIVERFRIKEAETYIQAYKHVVQSFYKETRASLCLNKTFKVTNSPPLLRRETAIFVLDWDPTGYTLQDIQDILVESLEGNVQIRDIRKGNSIIVNCFFPLNLMTSFIVKAQKSVEFLKKNGLLRLSIGHCIIYDKCQRDKVVIVLDNSYYMCCLLIYRRLELL